MLSLLLALPILGRAQQQLVVNGQPVAGLDTSVAGNGSSYAPADTFAAALGATYVYSPAEQSLTLELAGHLLTAAVTEGGREEPLLLDGVATQEVGAAVFSGGQLYLPIKPIVQALGGSVSYLASRQTVMVVFPRAKLTAVRLEREATRFVLDLTGLTSFETYYNRPLNTLQIRFERADDATTSPTPTRGPRFDSAALVSQAGYLDFRLRLEPGTRYETYTSPRKGAFSLVIDLLPPEVAADEGRDLQRIVIDPGHGGSDAGLNFGEQTEASLTLALAERLATALEPLDVEVVLTHHGQGTFSPTVRSQQGMGARLLISLHAADLITGQYNLYYLGDAEDAAGLEMVVRENARVVAAGENTDALRRRVLLDLVPDLAAGESYAATLQASLARFSFRANQVTSAPLSVLSGAAGRGVLLEFAPQDLADTRLMEALVAALEAIIKEEATN